MRKRSIIIPGADTEPKADRDRDPDRIETCVLCGTDTGYRRSQPIDQRLHYIEGAGQLCGRCFREIYNA